MNLTINRLSRIYALLTVLYPYSFRQDFASEMQAVFQEKLNATKRTGKWALWCDFWSELRDLPVAILTEYWFTFRDTFGRSIMFLITEDKSWRIKDRRDAIIASLPPVMMGFGIALGARVVWEPWHTIPRWRLLTGFAIMMLPGLLIGLGGLWALTKRVPPWGHIWIGATGMGLVLFVKTIAEERADFGLPLISPVMDIVIAIVLLIGITVLILVSAWQGWRHAGMVSLGFATMAGMASFSMATAAPFNRYDLALLAAPVGLVMASLIYLFVRKGDGGRIIAILVYGVMNAVVFFIVASIWDLPYGSPSPVIPFLIVLTGALLVGPIAGLIGRPVRRVVQGS
jgi:hypothetical protein